MTLSNKNVECGVVSKMDADKPPSREIPPPTPTTPSEPLAPREVPLPHEPSPSTPMQPGEPLPRSEPPRDPGTKV